MVLYCLHVHISSENIGADHLRGNTGTAQLICAFVFAYAEGRFSTDSARLYKQDIVLVSTVVELEGCQRGEHPALILKMENPPYPFGLPKAAPSPFQNIKIFKNSSIF